MYAEENLRNMGICLESVDRSGKSVIPVRRYRNTLFVSGHGPVGINGEALVKGRVGIELSEDQAVEAARLTAVSMLRTLKDYLGDLDYVGEWVKVLGLFNSGGDFYNMPKCLNGFSQVIVKTFGVRGCHARAAMGAPNHESGYAVMIDAVLKIR